MKTKMAKWFTPYRFVVPGQYEEWLEDLAQAGWQLDKVSHMSAFKMNFTKGEPKKYCFVVDLQPKPRKEYKQIYFDFGWELVGQMSSLYVWRKEYTDAKPQSFSDPYSVEKRNKRFTVTLSLIAALFSCTFVALAILFGVYFTRLTSVEQYMQFAAGLIVSGGIAVFVFSRLRKIFNNKKRDESEPVI